MSNNLVKHGVEISDEGIVIYEMGEILAYWSSEELKTVASETVIKKVASFYTIEDLVEYSLFEDNEEDIKIENLHERVKDSIIKAIQRDSINKNIRIDEKFISIIDDSGTVVKRWYKSSLDGEPEKIKRVCKDIYEFNNNNNTNVKVNYSG